MFANALHAIRTLFHHTAAAHGHIRIAHHLVLRRLPILKQQKIETSHFVRAVVRAVARAYAAVVGHVVQTFRAVYGCADRAHHLTGRVFALHTRYRLEIRFGIIAVALIVGVHAQPVHVASDDDLLLAHNRNVIFRLASDNAVVAAYAGVEVDSHAPCVGFL